MIIHDISLILAEGMVTYPSDVPFQRTLQRNLIQGDSSNVSVITTSAHVGTHVDSPRHYIRDGYGVEQIPLENLYGAVFVADCRNAPCVTADMLKDIVPSGTKRLLLKTDNSQLLHDNPTAPFHKNFVYLEASGARFAVEQGMTMVGIDYLSIDKSGLTTKDSHHILLENNITIMEGIVLAEIAPGEYFLACAPLKIAEADGAPCRAVLIEGLRP